MFRSSGHSSPRRRRLGACLALTLALAAGASAAPAPSRVVAVGDVHGDVAAFEEVLRAAGVLDAGGAWVAGDALVVQIGDLIDRGPQMKGALEFVMALEQKAARAGGRFVSVLGNHEVMNLVGDLRFVAAENYTEFAGKDSEKRRVQGWHDFKRWQQQRAARRGETPPRLGSAEKKAWLAAHPPGWLEQREAFAPEGRYGRWLRSRPTYVQEQGTVMVHGGLAPARAGASLAEIDRQVHEEIARFDELRRGFVAEQLVLPFFDLPELTLVIRAELEALDRTEAAARAAAEAAGRSRSTPAELSERRARFERFLDYRDWSIFAADGPLWFRGYSQWSDAEGAAELPRLLGAYHAQRFVVGHTVQPGGRVRVRFDGAVFLIDTGMLSSYVPDGRGAALEIAGESVTAIYAGGQRELVWGTPAAAAAPATRTAPAPEAASPPAAALAQAAEGLAPAAAETAAAAGSHRYLGPDGAPLPFADEGELLGFLREAEVVEVEDIDEGITGPRRLTLARGGVRARGVFRDVSEQKRVARLGGGRRELNFRDFYGFEPAAYRLARLFGFDMVPPADLRRFGGVSGSIQLWIEQATTEGRRRQSATTPPEPLRWKRQLQMMLIWDALVGNTDRNMGNFIYDPEWKLWLVDHTRSFRQSTDLDRAERILWCERGFYERLRSLSDDEIRNSVKGLLVAGEVRALLARRQKIVEHLEELVRARGESPVLFTWQR